jgi:hypothetical protein
MKIWAFGLNKPKILEQRKHAVLSIAKEPFHIQALSWTLLILIPTVLFFTWKKVNELSPTQAHQKRHAEISLAVTKTLKDSPSISQPPELLTPSWKQRFAMRKELVTNETFIGSNGTELMGVQKNPSGQHIFKRIEFMTTLKSRDGEKISILNTTGTLVGSSEFQTATTEELKANPAFAITQGMNENTRFVLTEIRGHDKMPREIAISKIPDTNLIILTEGDRSALIDYPKKLRNIFLICLTSIIATAILCLNAWRRANQILFSHAQQAQFSKTKMQNFLYHLAKNSKNSQQPQCVLDAISNLAEVAIQSGLIKDITAVQIILPSQISGHSKSIEGQTKFHFERTLDGKIEIAATNSHNDAECSTPHTHFLADDCMFMRLKIPENQQGFLICSRQAFADEFLHNADLGLLLMRALSSQFEITLAQIKHGEATTSQDAA